MSWYLMTDGFGQPEIGAVLSIFEESQVTAVVGQRLCTPRLKEGRATFYIARDPVEAIDVPAEHAWPARLFRVEYAGNLRPEETAGDWVSEVDVVEELSIFEAFAPQADLVQRLFGGMAAMSTEQWIRVYWASQALQPPGGEHAHPYFSTPSSRWAEMLPHTRITGDWRFDRLRTQARRAGAMARALTGEARAAALDKEEKNWDVLTKTAKLAELLAKAILLGDQLPRYLREEVLGLFLSAVGPIWEEPRRTEPRPPVVAPAVAPVSLADVTSAPKCFSALALQREGGPGPSL